MGEANAALVVPVMTITTVEIATTDLTISLGQLLQLDIKCSSPSFIEKRSIV
jgi:hypothetical protein